MIDFFDDYMIVGELYSLQGEDALFLYTEHGLKQLTENEAKLMYEKQGAEWVH